MKAYFDKIACLILILSACKLGDAQSGAASIFDAFNVEGTCRNNREYIYEKNDEEWGCQAILFVETRRLALCQDFDVRLNCPLSCGICCEDDPFYTFPRVFNGEETDCSFLSKKQSRQEKYCDLHRGGQMIRAGCPKSCNYCKSYVTGAPSELPSQSPTSLPTNGPSQRPTSSPTTGPTESPSTSPSVVPTILPTNGPSQRPTSSPTTGPTESPSTAPSVVPTMSSMPSTRPSSNPSVAPTMSSMPSTSPSSNPSKHPSSSPSLTPTASIVPTERPSISPSNAPSTNPSLNPSEDPSASPTAEPTMLPSSSPTSNPTESPTASPTPNPSSPPTAMPTSSPSHTPSIEPTTEPSRSPSSNPSSTPTMSPTDVPTYSPSASPSSRPSSSPTSSPSALPTFSPSGSPTTAPSLKPSYFPSSNPTKTPTASPSLNPSSSPSATPSTSPTGAPTDDPSSAPSLNPTTDPSSTPSMPPSDSPSHFPSLEPSSNPSSNPSSGPSTVPSEIPTSTPSSTPSSLPTEETKPNLIMILTDEHNLRTLSCYRDYLLSNHAYPPSVDVWGDIFLNTPNLDKLANEGAIFANFYTVAPLCTPSRASFMTGLYPPFTGAADQNHGKLDTNITTWAEILRAEGGYHTGYMGKWHLDGEEKPLWGSNNRDFGFEDNKYRYNRGHWKYFNEINGEVEALEMDSEGRFQGAYKEHFATDFLMDRGIEFIESAAGKDDPFALVLSIPDPHGPNENRPYYRNLYEDIHFKVPDSARRNWKFSPAPPGFNSFPKDEAPPIGEVDEWIEEFENGPFWQRHMRQYYGMVKCIDYNIGKLLRTLKDLDIDDNTMIVFTSDHGDTLMEHGKLNKGRPYETSAGIPFLVRYPDKVPAGKVVETAYSSVDFAPTILGLMGVEIPATVSFQGVDGSQELTSSQKLTNDQTQIVYSFDTGKTPVWAAAIKAGYKLVFSKSDVPWLFDVTLDPEEMHNFIDISSHSHIVEELRPALIEAMKKYNIPMGIISNFIYLDKPACVDRRDILPINNGKKAFCSDIGVTVNPNKCTAQLKISNHCPYTCKTCCKDSTGLMWYNGSAMRCDSLQNLCDVSVRVRQFCPSTCGECSQ